MADAFESTGDFDRAEFNSQWRQIDTGTLSSPTQLRLSRKKSNASAQICRQHIEARSPLCTYSFGMQHLGWFSFPTSLSIWQAIEKEVKRRKSKLGDIKLSLWESSDATTEVLVEIDARNRYRAVLNVNSTKPRDSAARSQDLVGILHGCLRTRTTYDEATAWPHPQQDQQQAA